MCLCCSSMNIILCQSVKRGYKDNTYARKSRNDKEIFGGKCCFKKLCLAEITQIFIWADPSFKCCRWEIGAVATFRSGVISIDNAEAAMDLVYALGLVTSFFIFSLHSILDRFIMQNKWVDFVKDLFDFCFN